MKCIIPEISWHNRDPVLSVDIQQANIEDFYRLASGGTDCHVLIWHLKIRENGGVDIDVVADLNKHQRSVNVVRWSPTGTYLATADDEAMIIIWNLKTSNIPSLDGETNDKEVWIINKILRGHMEDVYDLCWSPNEAKLLSGSIDNTAIMWNFAKGRNEHILSDHKGFVQGVTWDPKGQFIATLSSDRICRVYESTGKAIKSRAHKGILPLEESHPLFGKEMKYFHDDTFKSFFRRLSFSPDGNLLVTPSGCIESEDNKACKHTSYIFTLDCLTQPAAVLHSPKQNTIVVRFCPLLFELRTEEPVEPYITLPYRMIFAIGTDNDIVLYDTQQLLPFARFLNVHYTRITDLTWSSNGLLLMASSTDGFCTLVTFEPNELGTEYVQVEEIEVNEKTIVKKRSFLEKWAKSTPKSKTSDNTRASIENNMKCNISTKETDEIKQNNRVEENKSKKEVKKRIAPIKIEEVANKKPKVEETDINLTKKVVVRITSCDIEKAENKMEALNSGATRKRIAPIKIGDIKKPEIESETKVINTPKKRIVPIKIGEITKKLDDMETKQDEVIIVSDSPIKKVDDNTPTKIELKNNSAKSKLKTGPLLKFFTAMNNVNKSVKDKKSSENTANEDLISINISDDESILNDVSTQDSSNIEKENIVKEDENESLESKESEKINSATENDKSDMQNNLLDKPKRRVPLVTLTSAKRKKTDTT